MNRLLRSNEVIQSNEHAKLCLRYLNFGKVWQQPTLCKDSLASRPFRDYAARFWHQHIIAYGENYASVADLINILFNPANANWASWRIWFDSVEPRSNLTPNYLIGNSYRDPLEPAPEKHQYREQ
jgi:hypothetical protein